VRIMHRIVDEQGNEIALQAIHSGLALRVTESVPTPEGDIIMTMMLPNSEMLKAARSLLAEAAEILDQHSTTSVEEGDGYWESYNNEDVIDLREKIRRFLNG
jgi:hypothetical protein